MTQKISPSKIRLAQLCGYPWSRSAPAWPSLPPGESAVFGTAVHEAAEYIARHGGLPNIEELAEKHRLTPAKAKELEGCATAIARSMELEVDELEELRPEVAIAFDPTTGVARELRSRHHRDYSDAKSHEIAGSMDLVIKRNDGALVVRDWKTGFKQSRELDVRTDPQLLTYALMAHSVYGGARVIVQLAHVSENGVRIDETEIDIFDLDAHYARLVELLEATLGKEREPTAGPHCHGQYCPLVSVCPKTQALVATVGEPPPAEFPFVPEVTSPAHAVSLYHRLRVVREACDQVEAGLKGYVSKTPVEVEPGLFYGAVECKGKERIEAGVAGAVSIIRKHLEDSADIALEVETSKAGLERGARHLLSEKGEMERGAIKRVMEPLLEDLRKHGALKQGPDYTKVDTFKKKASGK